MSDELYNRYKQIKIVDPKTPSFQEWKLKLGLEAWEKARFENRTKKNTGGFVNKPMKQSKPTFLSTNGQRKFYK